MNRFLVTLAVVCLFMPSVGLAQMTVPTPNQVFIDCGNIILTNTAKQYGHYNLFLEYIVGTTRAINVCPLSVTVEAYVQGVDGSGYASSGWFSASANRQVLVPYPEVWTSKGLHGLLLWYPSVPGTPPPPAVFELPPTVASANIRYQSEPESDPVFDCEVLQGGTWLGGEFSSQTAR